MSRLDDVTQQWAEDATLRGDLTDAEAETLLAWAQVQLAQADRQAQDDADFETRASALRRLVKRLNQTAGAISYAAPNEHAEQFAALQQAASAAGYAAPDEPVVAQGADGGAYLSALLAVLTPPAQPAPATLAFISFLD